MWGCACAVTYITGVLTATGCVPFPELRARNQGLNKQCGVWTPKQTAILLGSSQGNSSPVCSGAIQDRQKGASQTPLGEPTSQGNCHHILPIYLSAVMASVFPQCRPYNSQNSRQPLACLKRYKINELSRAESGKYISFMLITN